MAAENMTNWRSALTVLTSMYEQVTGQRTLTATNTAEFVHQAETVLRAGYDPILNAISQVLTRTMFASRPYTRKLVTVYNSTERFGNHERKINYIDLPFTADVALDPTVLVDGASVDQWAIRKPKVVQTNFYGSEGYGDQITQSEHQINTAFRSPDELARFWAGMLQEIRNKHEQAEESFTRGLIANAIGAKVIADSGSVRHLVTEYNAYTGESLTSATVKAPENVVNFAKWLAGELRTTIEFLTERTALYHVNPAAGNIMRHTPRNMQRVFMNTGEMNQIVTRVLSDVFHDELLRTVEFENVNFWQAVDSPMEINVTPSYLDATTGAQATGAAQVLDNVLGIIWDRDFMGYTRIDEYFGNTGMNKKGRYANLFWSWTFRYYQDLTENAVVLLLD